MFAAILLFAACNSSSGTGTAGESGDGHDHDHDLEYNQQGSGVITLYGEVTNCASDSFYLFEIIGKEATPIGSVALEKTGVAAKFTMFCKLPQKAIYLLGPNPQQSTQIILGDEDPVNFAANCTQVNATASITNSPQNDAFKTFTNTINQYNQNIQQSYNNLRMFSMSNPSVVPQLQTELQNLQQQRATFLEGEVNKGGLLGKIASLYYFRPFGSDPNDAAKYQNDRYYLMNEFFAGIDMNDPQLSTIPQFYSRCSEYTASLGQGGIPEDSLSSRIDGLLASVKVGSPNHMTALRAFLEGFQQSKSSLYVQYGRKYLAEYTDSSPLSQQIRANVSAMEITATGAIPPDISLTNPDGKTVSLSSLRGNVVMLDFWASWCKPCRAENPNVVKAYNKYHSKGFEILGVSLDKNKAPWVGAIAQDGLIWKHVSDLKGWQSAPARDYGVTSIPMTFLLDKEGRIIGKNLRGPALEAKLAELFGS